MDEYDKNWLQLRCTWVDEDGYTHKDSNACLLARALEREEDESPVFSDGRAVLAGLTVEEIGSLAARWSVLRRESDQGLNVTEEELERIHAILEGDESKLPKNTGRHTSIGIQNVNRRIRLVYGDEYGLSIEQEEDCITVSTITIPYVDHEDEISLKERSEAQNELKNIARLNK